MAKLTDPGAAERPTPGGPAGVAQIQVPFDRHPGGFGLTQLGGDIEHAGTELFHAQKVEEDRINSLAAEDAYTRLRQQQLDLTMDPKSGFASLKGAAAVNRPVLEEYSKKFDDARSSIAAGLTNDRQREKFKLRADVTRQQYQEEILRHVGHESDVYSKEVYDGTMAVELRSVIAHWNSPNDVGTSLERVKHAVDERADRYGWAPEFRDAMLKAEEGKMHAAVVGEAIASGNYKYGEQWYNQHKDQIDLTTAKALEFAVRDGAQKELTAGYTADFLAGRNDMKTLDALQTRVMGDSTLDDTRKNMLVGRIQSRSDVIERRAMAVQQAAERQITKMINTVNTNTRAGYEPTMDQMAPIISAAKGTAMESEAQDMVNLANATRKFRLASPNQQEQMLNDLETRAHADPSRFDIQAIHGFREIHEAQKRQLQNDPQTYAVRQGLAEPKPLDLSKPADAGDQLKERFAIGRALSANYGAPFKPLTETEVSLVSTALKRASPDDKRTYFGGLATAAADDHEGYSAIMSQLAPDDPVTAIAGDYAGKKRTAASDLMLRGQAILSPPSKSDGKPDHGKTWPMPPEKELDMAFSQYEQNAFAGRPQLRNAMHQAAKAIYAAKSADAGDASGILDSQRWDESVLMATGGITRYNGKALLLPYNWQKSEFVDALDRRIDQALDRSVGPVTFDENFNTRLEPGEEKDFERWRSRYAPHDSGMDYDLRGAFKAGVTPSANGHFPDTYKKPNHPTFSDQSNYARFGTPGTWQGETFIPAPAGSKPMAEYPKAQRGQLDPSITKEKLIDLPLEPIGDGRYVFRAGDGVVVDRTNKPLIIDFNTEMAPDHPAVENTTVPEHQNILQ